MPDFPKWVEVATSGSKTLWWEVDNMATCRDCQAEIFWCYTGNLKPDGTQIKGCVNADPDELGLYRAHQSTCPFVKGKPRTRGGRRPHGGDRPR